MVYWWDPCYHIYIYTIHGSYHQTAEGRQPPATMPSSTLFRFHMRCRAAAASLASKNPKRCPRCKWPAAMGFCIGSDSPPMRLHRAWGFFSASLTTMWRSLLRRSCRSARSWGPWGPRQNPRQPRQQPLPGRHLLQEADRLSQHEGTKGFGHLDPLISGPIPSPHEYQELLHHVCRDECEEIAFTISSHSSHGEHEWDGDRGRWCPRALWIGLRRSGRQGRGRDLGMLWLGKGEKVEWLEEWLVLNTAWSTAPGADV